MTTVQRIVWSLVSLPLCSRQQLWRTAGVALQRHTDAVELDHEEHRFQEELATAMALSMDASKSAEQAQQEVDREALAQQEMFSYIDSECDALAMIIIGMVCRLLHFHRRLR